MARGLNFNVLEHHRRLLPLKSAELPAKRIPLRLGLLGTNLLRGRARCGGEFRTTFRTIPASVAQWIEQRFPKPQVAGSIPAGGAHGI